MWSFSQQSFFIPTPTLLNPNFRNSRKTVVVHCSCSQPQQQQSPTPLSNWNKNENKLGKLALIAMAASVLTYRSVHDASAAKTGGRIGGQAFKSAWPRINDDISGSDCFMPDYDHVLGFSLCYLFGLLVSQAIGGVFTDIFLIMHLAAGAAVVWRWIRLETSVYAS
ncbi:unnamed protein product [Lathyrus sativus]|nr:unnamed protein product [Lathyrus sativus]